MQWCSDQNPNFELNAMDHRDWPGKQWWAERQACRCTHLTARFPQQSSLFEGLNFIKILFLYVSFLFQNSTTFTLLCRQNRIFVDMYFLKIAVLSPILSTKRLSFNDSTITNYQIVMFSKFVFVLTKYHYWALEKRKIVFHALLLFYVSKIFCREFSRQWWTLWMGLQVSNCN